MLELFPGTLLPLQPWERQAAAAMLMSESQFRFVISFFVSPIIAYFWRHVPSITGRHVYALSSGLLLVYYPFGNQLLSAFPLILVCWGALVLVPRRCGTVTWAISFPYLLICHGTGSALAWKKGELDFTGALMVLVLKLVALGMCRQDAARPEKVATLSAYSQSKRVDTPPGLLEMLGYCFAIGNLLAGPFFEFVDYRQYVQRQGEWADLVYDPKTGRHPPSGVLRGFLQSLKSFLCLGLYLVLNNHLPFTMLRTPAYLAASQPRKWVMIYQACIIARMKFYFVWALSEASLMFSGFAFNGWRDPDAKAGPLWNRYINTDIRRVEFCESAAVVPQYWNICTGKWLRYYVYERLTPHGKKPTLMTLMITQLVSSVWHGLFWGYFLFFASTTFMFQSAKVIYKQEKWMPKAVWSSWLWRILKMLYTIATLNYLATAFIGGTWETAYYVWSTVYFVPHIIMIGLTALDSFLPSPPREKPGPPGAVQDKKEQ